MRRSSGVLLAVGLIGVTAVAVWLLAPRRVARDVDPHEQVAAVLPRAAEAVARRDAQSVAELIAPEGRALGQDRDEFEASLRRLFASRGFPVLRLEWGEPEIRVRGARASLGVDMVVRERRRDLDIVYARGRLTLALERHAVGDAAPTWTITSGDVQPPIRMHDVVWP
ncbi:MAG TPA: hypothetical protein VLH79_08025 [Chthonomonadales bacterium]|nr:hypothetical protein [Chthonomonadales bacterium]